MNNSIFPTLNGTMLGSNSPAVFQKRLAIKGVIIRLIIVLSMSIAVSACNSKQTANDAPATTNPAPGTTRNGEDDGHMGQHGEAGTMNNGGEMSHGASGRGMMGDGHDTTANGMHMKGMDMKHKGMGMMNR